MDNGSLPKLMLARRRLTHNNFTLNDLIALYKSRCIFVFRRVCPREGRPQLDRGQDARHHLQPINIYLPPSDYSTFEFAYMYTNGALQALASIARCREPPAASANKHFTYHLPIILHFPRLHLRIRIQMVYGNLASIYPENDEKKSRL
jgi:hypothetical protein